MATSYTPPDSSLNYPLTVRDRILFELLQRIASIVNDISPTEGDAGDDLFSEVQFGDTQESPPEARPVCGIIEGEEEATMLLYPYVDKELRISLEFRWLPKTNVDNHFAFRYYLGKLQKRLFGSVENLQMRTAEFPDGMTLNVREERNYPQIEGPSDDNPSGVLDLTVTYRHVNGDPEKFHLDE